MVNNSITMVTGGTSSSKNTTLFKSRNQSYFKMNGQVYHVTNDIKSKSQLNIAQTPMYVSKSKWGYNYLQWLNFSGEEITLTVLCKSDDLYNGNKVYPDTKDSSDTSNSDNDDIYNKNPTTYAMLKYWAQMFVTVTVETNLQAIEDGEYKITEFSQSHLSPSGGRTNPSNGLVSGGIIQSEITLVHFEKEMHQQYYSAGTISAYSDSQDTSDLTLASAELGSLGTYSQQCKCNSTNCKKSQLERGCTATVSDDVKIIQKYLARAGYIEWQYWGKTPTGMFCYHTTTDVKAFQKSYGLPVNGVFNKATRDALLKTVTNT